MRHQAAAAGDPARRTHCLDFPLDRDLGEWD
jgi:hypothetical protein